MIFNCPKLTYLDSRPIQPRDRAVISAWKEVKSPKCSALGQAVQGGIEAERRERERLIQQEQKDMQDSILALIRNRWRVQFVNPAFKLMSRDQRLAEKGISSMEEHTAEIKRKILKRYLIPF